MNEGKVYFCLFYWRKKYLPLVKFSAGQIAALQRRREPFHVLRVVDAALR